MSAKLMTRLLCNIRRGSKVSGAHGKALAASGDSVNLPEVKTIIYKINVNNKF